MKRGSKNKGFTLVETLVVMAIIVLLAGIAIGLARRIDEQGKIRLCRNTLALIDSAIEQFREFGYDYKNTYPTPYTAAEAEFYRGLKFPIDCNGFNTTALPLALGNALYGSQGEGIFITAHDPNFSGSEVLYFILNQVSDCRTTLDKINKTLLTNKDKNGNIITITTPSATLPFTRIEDPWKMSLRYDYYDVDTFTLKPILGTEKTFPVITSAGPDKRFDTTDDIINNQSK